jgi:hypothetical protein
LRGLLFLSGDGEIRTLDTVSHIHTFQACSFSHSDTSPLLFQISTPIHTFSRSITGLLQPPGHVSFIISNQYPHSHFLPFYNGTPSATRTRLLYYFKSVPPFTLSPVLQRDFFSYSDTSPFLKGRQKYSINHYKPNIFWALAVVVAATSSAVTFFICASFSNTYFK